MTPRLLLIGSLGFTLLFNVVWAWRDGPSTAQGWLSVAAAAVCTLIVPAGLHLWAQVPAPTWCWRIVRAVVMFGICASAAITSFSHSVEVLLGAGWNHLTAWSVTGGAELLVALSTMALRGSVDRSATAVTPVVRQQSTKADRVAAPGPETNTWTVADRVADRALDCRPLVDQTGPVPAARTVADRVVDRVVDRLADCGPTANETGPVPAVPALLGPVHGPELPPVTGPDETASEQQGRPGNTSRVTDDEVLVWLRDRADETGRVPGRKETIDRWPIGAGRADRLREATADPDAGRDRLRSVQ